MLAKFESNIRFFMSQATVAEYRDGLSWYDDAHSIMQDIASNSRFTAKQVASFIAILSARNDWNKNVEYARYFATTGKTVKPNGKSLHTAQNVNKLLNASKATTDDQIWRSICKDYGKRGKSGNLVKSGLANKTLNFYFNILSADVNRVTVDAHAAGVCLNDFAMGYDQRGFSAIQHYEDMAQAYQNIGAELGLAGYQVQAVTWLTYRRMLAEYRKANNLGSNGQPLKTK